ncbi:hypothetical protein SAFG77S_11240 [Streptomyces afghaniensis]
MFVLLIVSQREKINSILIPIFVLTVVHVKQYVQFPPFIMKKRYHQKNSLISRRLSIFTNHMKDKEKQINFFS